MSLRSCRKEIEFLLYHQELPNETISLNNQIRRSRKKRATAVLRHPREAFSRAGGDGSDGFFDFYDVINFECVHNDYSAHDESHPKHEGPACVLVPYSVNALGGRGSRFRASSR